MAKRSSALDFLKLAMQVYNGRMELSCNEITNVKTVTGCSIPSIIWNNCKVYTDGSKKVTYSLGLLAEIAGVDINALECTEMHPSESTDVSNTNIVKDALEVRSEPVVKAIVSNIEQKVTETITTVNNEETYTQYIPLVNKNFIPFGSNYKLIDSIISSNDFCPIYVHGLSGVGKTMQIEQAAAKYRRPFFRAQITRESTNEDLIGSYALKDGETVWKDGPVLKAYRSGGILLLDEIDLNPGLMMLQVVLENKPIYVSQTGELVYPKAGFNVFATGNTKGDGSDSRFVGTSVMNDAFLERFVTIIEQKIPTIANEKKIIKTYLANEKIEFSEELLNNFLKWIDMVRGSYENGYTDVYISSRRVQYILKMFKITGDFDKSMGFALARYSDEQVDAFVKVWKAIVETTPVTITAKQDIASDDIISSKF